MNEPKKVIVVNPDHETPEVVTSDPQSAWQRNSFMVFEVTASPKPDFFLRGQPVAIVRKYRFNPMRMVINQHGKEQESE